MFLCMGLYVTDARNRMILEARLYPWHILCYFALQCFHIINVEQDSWWDEVIKPFVVHILSQYGLCRKVQENFV